MYIEVIKSLPILIVQPYTLSTIKPVNNSDSLFLESLKICGFNRMKFIIYKKFK